MADFGVLFEATGYRKLTTLIVIGLVQSMIWRAQQVVFDIGSGALSSVTKKQEPWHNPLEKQSV
jgi:hypothetical protein